MTVLVFSIIVLWCLLVIRSVFITCLAYRKIQVKKTDKLNKVPEPEKNVSVNSILDQNPELKAIIKNIIAYESKSHDEKCRTRAAILRAKLKMVVRNPVIRAALIDVIKNK